MNAFNRVALAAYSLLWIAACAGIAALAWNSDQKLDLSLGSVNIQAFVASDDSDRWLFTGILSLLAFLGLITLATAFRRAATEAPGFVRVPAPDGSVVEVAASALESLLKTEIERLPQVRQALIVVRVEGEAVRPEITVSVEPGWPVTDLTKLIGDRAAAVLREDAGIARVRRPDLRITHEALAASPAGRMRPQAPAVPREGDLPPPPPTPAAPPPPAVAMPAPPSTPSSLLPEPPRPTAAPPATIAVPPLSSPPAPPPPPVEPGGSATTPGHQEPPADD